jgi:hypothetical protein
MTTRSGLDNFTLKNWVTDIYLPQSPVFRFGKCLTRYRSHFANWITLISHDLQTHLWNAWDCTWRGQQRLLDQRSIP